jgi:RNA polymerase sigma-70 factor (ECF subfamily)
MSDAPVSPDRDFGRLYAQYQTRLYGFIRTLLANHSDAEDVLQETASVLWRKFGDFQPGSSFLAWGLEVARYQAMSFQKKQRKETAQQFSEAFVQALANETVAQSARLADLRTDLDECMGRLSAEDRDIFERRYCTEVTTQAVARHFGKPATTIYSALARIRQTLVECVTAALGREARLS